MFADAITWPLVWSLKLTLRHTSPAGHALQVSVLSQKRSQVPPPSLLPTHRRPSPQLGVPMVGVQAAPAGTSLLALRHSMPVPAWLNQQVWPAAQFQGSWLQGTLGSKGHSGSGSVVSNSSPQAVMAPVTAVKNKATRGRRDANESHTVSVIVAGASLLVFPKRERHAAHMPRHFRSLHDVSSADFERIIALSTDVKKNPDAYRTRLAGRSIAMIFSKPSTRTRVSFEVGIRQLGAFPMFLSAGGATGLQVNRGESNGDTAKVLSRYVDAIVIRTFAQQQVDELAEHGSVPVVNALTDSYHPCQALADVLTMKERFGDIAGLKMVFVGPGNNVTHSLMNAGPRAGFDVVCACPEDLPPDPQALALAVADAEKAGTSVRVEHDVRAAMKGAHVIYTDTWVSMGQEAEAEALKAKLAPYQVTEELMGLAEQNAIFMHCLPAHRGEEATAAVIDGPRSVVFDEAENRLHTQKALLLLLMGAELWS